MSSKTMLQKRQLCSQASAQMNNMVNNRKNPSNKWKIKQVTRSNFKQVLEEVKSHIFSSDFIAFSLQKTGAFSAPWQRVLPFDTADTAYFKAKRAADRFQIFQFALCPFTLTDSKLTAYPYNFQLFPRDELKIGMPSYSFACQTSYLTSMARLGFDFNACIYDGISYLSRAQESVVKHLSGNNLVRAYAVQSSPASSIADSVFLERIKSRVRNWRLSCADSAGQRDDPLIRSLKKVVFGEDHGSRPSMDIDVCSERQVQLVLEVLKEFSDDIVPLIVPAKRGGTQGVRIVFTNSKEDKVLFEKELQELEEEQSKRVRGFREVIDMISASQKPIVAHNSLDGVILHELYNSLFILWFICSCCCFTDPCHFFDADLTFIHSKFIGPLPPSIDEFKVSLRSNFPNTIDLGHLMKEINPSTSMKSLTAASAFLKNRFFAPIEIDIPLEGSTNEMNVGKTHGQNVLRISQLFAKLCSVLKRNTHQVSLGTDFVLKNYANSFGPCGRIPLEGGSDEDVELSSGNMRRLNCDYLVFLWGFGNSSSAGELKRQLARCHEAFSEDFDVKLVDKNCAVVAFWRSGLAGVFLDAVNSEGIGHQGLRDMISEGLRATDYETYKRVCEMGLWNSDLADSLDQAVRSTEQFVVNRDGGSPYEIWWDDRTVINLDEL